MAIIKTLKKIFTIGSLVLAGSTFYSGGFIKKNIDSYGNISKNLYLTEDSLLNEDIKLISKNYFEKSNDSTSFEKAKEQYEEYKKRELEKILKEEKETREKEKWEKGFYLTPDSLNKCIQQAYKNIKKWPKEFDKKLFRLLLKLESGRNVYAVSPTGYLGLGQIGEDTYKTFKPEKYETFRDPITGEFDTLAYKRELFNPIVNLEISLKDLNHISNFCKKYHPKWNTLSLEEKQKVILACYSAGPTMIKDIAKWDIKSKGLKKDNRDYPVIIMEAYNNPKVKVKL